MKPSLGMDGSAEHLKCVQKTYTIMVFGLGPSSGELVLQHRKTPTKQNQPLTQLKILKRKTKIRNKLRGERWALEMFSQKCSISSSGSDPAKHTVPNLAVFKPLN